MESNILCRADLKRAGRIRYNRAYDLVGYLQGLDGLYIDAALTELQQSIMGGAEEALQYFAAATALTASQVAFMGTLYPLPSPLIIAWAYVPTITTVTATSTLTFNFNRTDTPAVIGGQVQLAPTAGTKSFLNMMCIVPAGIPAANGVTVSGQDSAATAVPTGTATQPMVFTLLGVS